MATENKSSILDALARREKRHNKAVEVSKEVEGDKYTPLSQRLPVFDDSGSALSEQELMAGMTQDQLRREDRINSPGWQAARGFLNSALPGLYVQPDLQGFDLYNPLKGQPEVNPGQVGVADSPEARLGSSFSDAMVGGQLAGMGARGLGVGARALSSGSAKATGEAIQGMTKAKAFGQIPEAMRSQPELLTALRGLEAGRKTASGAHALLNVEDVAQAVGSTKPFQGNLRYIFEGTGGLKGLASPLGAKAVGAGLGVVGEASDQLKAEDAAAAGQGSGGQAPVVAEQQQFISTPPDDRGEYLEGAPMQAPVAQPKTSEQQIRDLMAGNKGLKSYQREEGFFDRVNKRLNPATYRQNKMKEENQFLVNQILQSEYVDPQTKALLANFNNEQEAAQLGQQNEAQFGRQLGLERQQAASQLARNQPWALSTRALSQATGIPEEDIRPEILSKILNSKLGAQELIQQLLRGQQGVPQTEEQPAGQLPALDLTR